MFASREFTERFFQRVTARPVTVLVLALLFIVAGAGGLTRLVKDTSIKAFIPAGHPSLVADDKAKGIFGLSDAVAVAVLARDGKTVFEPETLALIAELSERLAELPNIRPDRVASLATESSIDGDGDGLRVDPYVDRVHLTRTTAEESRQRWRRMPPHQGTLASEDGRGAVVMAEIEDPTRAADTYARVLELVAGFENADADLHVAGPGAVSGYLSRYIDRDARKLQPMVFVLVLGFIYLAFRRASALPGPLFVVLGSAGGALGFMAWLGIPYYAITNALPVILVAISVADAIHVLSAYYQYREERPEASVRALVIEAMVTMARPITLTTLTTIAGFVGIATVSIMPPITCFAWFAALGVALAWVFSIIALPNVLLLLEPGRSPAFANWREHRPSPLGVWSARVGGFAHRRHGLVITFFTVQAIVAVFFALQLRVDRSQVDNFAADEPIRIADQLINERFAGTAFLDVVIESDEPEGLLSAHAMQKIVDLQRHFEAQPHVRKTVSIADYIGLLHRALGDAPASAGDYRALPEFDDAIAQYLLVYEVSGDPTDFEEEIDASRSTALLRGILNADHFSEQREVVQAMERYLETEFNEPGLTASLAGDVNVGYHWMSSLRISHFKGVAISLALVLATSIVIFGSATAGLISVVPVLFTVLVLYACMGFLGIYLEPATSMFAAIAIGVGVDFAIHLVERLRTARAQFGGDLARAIEEALPPVARACFYNSAALGLGFSVLLVSDLPTLQRFGGLVTLAALSSYFSALFIVPALLSVGRMRARGPVGLHGRRVGMSISLLLLALFVTALLADDARAAGDPALRVAGSVSERREGTAARRNIEMTLTDRRGRVRERRALVLKESDEETRRTRITYLEPKSVRDVAFLSHDSREDSSADRRWLFIPAARKVRRIPASERGDYFLGTDFTYEDIQSELKFDLEDYTFEYLGREVVEGRTRHTLAGKPRTDAIARALGYGAFRATVDEESWLPLRVEFFDLREEPLKTIEVRAHRQVSGIWTATDIVASNHQTGHQTRFLISDVEYPPSLPEGLFDAQQLSRGLPGSVLAP